MSNNDPNSDSYPDPDQISEKRTQILLLLAETNAFLVDFQNWMSVYQDLSLYQKITLIDSLLSSVHNLQRNS